MMGISGELSGANHWADLRDVVAELLLLESARVFLEEDPMAWARLSPVTCAGRIVIVDGEPRAIKAAVIDGCNSTRHPKGKVYE